MSRTPPEPPTGPPTRAVVPVTETLAAGTRLWRVHPVAHHGPGGLSVPDDGTLFNPGRGGPTRFAPLHTLSGGPVATLYVGASRRGALFESALHDQMPGSVVDSARWRHHMLTALTLTTDLAVVSLHGAGLRSLGLYAADITHTYPSAYPLATRWAAWLHNHTPAAGLAWSSHQDDDERAFILWGDRTPPGSLVPETTPTGDPNSIPIGFGEGLDWVMGVAASVRIDVF